MDVLQLVNLYVKLLAFDFLTLKPIAHVPIIFSHKGRHLSRTETMNIKFDIDDGFVNLHVKLLAFDFLTLKPIPHVPIIFSRKGRPLAHKDK
ncbi:hypothetical protein H5410_031619 [Solanum commersonii]|uniref:Uncharacterized protein n=1 Tax=Solanum commersonii TaxID=4109 RepID=A0A9J5YIV1_SOLCO|nr:hypothetical protein H5410_031619 [Solanum commersonii]